MVLVPCSRLLQKRSPGSPNPCLQRPPVGASGASSWSTAIPAQRCSTGQAHSFLLPEAALGAPAHLPPSYRSASPTSRTAFSFQEGCPGFAGHSPQTMTCDEQGLRLGASMAKASSLPAVCLQDVLLGVDGAEGCGGTKQRGNKTHCRSDSRPEKEVTKALTTCVGFVCLFAVLCYVFRSWLFP